MSEKIKLEDFFGASNHKLIIRDIFAMYHHPRDIIGELIQNAVDSVLVTAEQPPRDYKPSIKITYNKRTLEIIVEDNGIGIPGEQIKKIAAPHVSFKKASEATRGEFGVGLTFVGFSANDFKLESICENTKSILEIKNGYSWTMDEGHSEILDIIFNLESVSTEPKSYTKVHVKPIRFPEYTLPQLKYILQRYTAIGDFWACYRQEDGPIKVDLEYIDGEGQKKTERVPNKFWHPADFIKQLNVDTVSWVDVNEGGR
jgi:hypothetical protein